MEQGAYQTWKLICIFGLRTETRQGINAVEVFLYLRLFLFDYKALFVCVTDRTCLRIAIFIFEFRALFVFVTDWICLRIVTSAYCFNIFRSNFGLLFCLLDRKLILGSKPIWESIFRWTKKKQHFILHIGMWSEVFR